MGYSALGELGNISGGALINCIADATDLELHPRPPNVIRDMAGALADTLITEIASLGGEVVIIETCFQDESRGTSGLVLITPEPSSLTKLLTRLGKGHL